MRKFIDLFCGIGGFHIALQKQGMDCVFSSDIDEKARTAYYQNFGDKPEGDITKIPERDIPAHDILCAGFPCQSFSISGKKLGVNDTRGRLFYEIVRIAEYHQPSILLLENVKNIVSVDGGKTLKIIEKKLDEAGYEMNLSTLNASNFGIPQKRERTYFVCLRKDISNLSYRPPKGNFKHIYLENILEKQIDNKLYINRKDIFFKENPILGYHLKPVRVGIVNKGGQGERIYSTKGHAITLSAYGGGVGARTGLYQTEKGIRRLSIVECKRVMGFSDNHYVSNGMRGYQELGNAVIPKMIESVYHSIRERKA